MAAGTVAAGTVPKDFTPSSGLITGAAIGGEDIDPEVSSIDPKVTAEPDIRDMRLKS